MPEQKKETRIYTLILILMAAFATCFVSTMGYINYRTVAITLEEQVIGRVEEEMVSGLENAISFGKSFENYYGMNEVFASFCEQYAGPQPFIIDNDGALMYSYAPAEEAEEAPRYEIGEFLSSEEMARALPSLEENGREVVSAGRYRAIFAPIHQDDRRIGYFGALYTDAIFKAGFSDLIRDLLLSTGIFFIVEFIAIFIFVRIIRSSSYRSAHRRKADRMMERLLSIAILAVGILLLSASSIYLYQKDYRARVGSSIRTSMHNLEMQVEHVKEQGVDLREVEDLKDYIAERVYSLDALHTVRITERISEVKRTEETSDLITLAFDSEGMNGSTMYLEAEVSDDAMAKEMRSIILVLTSTTIILLIFVFELNNLVDLLTGGIAGLTGKESFSEKRVSLSLRFTSFLCSTAEYMCVPYAAMMIRESGESLFGLSVGMTAALPLTLEGLTQMVSMLVLPRFVRKFNVRAVLFFSAVMMAACNIAAFTADGALAIVLCRALAGVAYAGFKQVSNYLITRGYDTEEGRSENISQDNAGLLAGATCGAGLGAILSSSAGYSATFLVSAVVFIVYLLITWFLLPWKPLSQRAAAGEGDKPIVIGGIIRMLFSPEMLFFILVIAIPLNIGVMLCVTLVPAICQTKGLSPVLLSYCYIANGLAGIYLGPALVTKAKAKLGLAPSIALAFALTSVSIFILHVPPVVVMIVITSMILGFLDGFGTPMVTDRFMTLKIVRNAVDESTALIFSVVLSYVLLTFAPMVAELLLLPGKGALSPMMIGAVIYAAAAALVFFMRGSKASK